MAARKSNATAQDAQRAAFIAAPTPAAAARVIGVDGKRVRAYLRGTLGVHVSQDASAYNADARNALYERFAPKPDASK